MEIIYYFARRRKKIFIIILTTRSNISIFMSIRLFNFFNFNDKSIQFEKDNIEIILKEENKIEVKTAKEIEKNNGIPNINDIIDISYDEINHSDNENNNSAFNRENNNFDNNENINYAGIKKENIENNETYYFPNNEYEELNVNENILIKVENYNKNAVKTRKENPKDKYIRLFKTFDAKLIKNNLLTSINRVNLNFLI